MKTAVVSCMRNEGPFLLEWVAYHRVIGFDEVVVITNDCTDGTDKMLDRLQHMGVVRHISQKVVDGESPQLSGMKLAFAHAKTAKIDWLLHVDCDEFLNVSTGEGRVQDLLALYGHADNIALLWRAFGDSGQRYWRGGSVLRQFTQCQAAPRQASALHKSLYRPDRFECATDHMPKGPVDRSVTSVTSTGRSIGLRPHRNPTSGRYRINPAHLTWENACIHHYAIRSQDVFLMKNKRGDGMARLSEKYMLNSTFHKRYNKNDVTDLSMHRHMPSVEALLSDWLEDAELRALDQLSLQHFQSARDAFMTPEMMFKLSIAS